MNQLPSNAEHPARPTGPDRRARHGLIEDGRDAMGILLLLFVAAALGALLARFWPESDVDGQPAMAELDTRVSTLEARLANLTQSGDTTKAIRRIDALEKRIQGLETRFAAVTVPDSTAPKTTDPAAPAPAPTLLSTAKRLDETQARLTDLETRTGALPADMQQAGKSLETLTAATTGLTTRLDDMAARVEKIETADILDLARRAALATAVANLARATQGSAPFGTEFDTMAGLLPDDADLKGLEPWARRGLPTTGTLIAGFGKAAADALNAERKGQQTDTVSRLWTGFSGLVTWRSTSGQSGSPTERRLARAETLLHAGDLEAALRELSPIRGIASRQLEPWLRDARARVKLEQVLARLNTRAISAIAPAQAPGPGPAAPPAPR